MKKVFISYSSADSAIASQLNSAMENLSVSGWLDQSDIASGEATAKKVRESIRQASALIVLITPNSIKSQWVQFEIGAAFAMDKPVIPVVVGPKGIEQNLPDWLEGIMYIDARNRSMKNVVQEISKFIINQK